MAVLQKTIVQRIKDYLVRLGPNNPATQLALRLHSKRRGFEVSFEKNSILIERRDRRLMLAIRDFYLVPITLECFDESFGYLEPDYRGGTYLLDFSRPGIHRYRRHEMELLMPGIAEDDTADTYTRHYRPKPGDTVWDIGAHAGFTTIVFSRMVGETGRVIAFEPDPLNVEYLGKNLTRQNVRNAVIVPKAVDAVSGVADFNSDGTMGAGLVEHSIYGSTGDSIEVATISLEDAAHEYGTPQLIKMDIEGAELAVIKSASAWLRRNTVNLAFDSYHRLPDGRVTWMLLEPLLNEIGYDTESAREGAQMFTWGRPSQYSNVSAPQTHKSPAAGA